jgi:4-amino-4-deoxy-L-arabinose transferase-like glycosyltransferase
MSTEGTAPIPRKVGICLVVIALCHLLISSWFSSVTPYRTAGYELRLDPATGRQAEMKDIGAPDERQHVNYIRDFMASGKFPVLDPKDPNLYENYQAHQPPLYYSFAVAWAKITGTQPDLESKSDGTKLRFLSAIFGIITIWGTFALARACRFTDGTALLAAGITAFLPMNLALSGAVSNDPLLFCLSTWTLVWIVRGLCDGWDTKTIVAVGICAGLAAVTKTTAAALFVAIFAAGVIGPRFTVSEALSKRGGAWFALGVGLLIAGPWWLRNFTIYGDPFALKVFSQAFTGSPQASAFIDGLGPTTYWIQMVGWWTARSFIGAFGYMNIWLTDTGGPNGGSQVYIVSLAILAIGGVVGLTRLRTNTAASVVLGLYTVVIFALFFRFNMQYFQAQARYVFPALAPIAVLVAAGWSKIGEKRNGIAVSAIVIAVAVPLALAVKKIPEGFERRLHPIERS